MLKNLQQRNDTTVVLLLNAIQHKNPKKPNNILIHTIKGTTLNILLF